jgi:hypothetical protein
VPGQRTTRRNLSVLTGSPSRRSSERDTVPAALPGPGEVASDADLLRDLGCSQDQGYLFEKPGIRENVFPVWTSDRSFA